MALSSLTLLNQTDSTATQTSLASGSFTPTANALLIVIAAVASGNTTEPLPTGITDSVGLTWTKQVEESQISDIRTAMACVFTAIAPASPSSMTVTVSWQNDAPRNTVWVAEIATGYDSTTPVRQVQSAGANGASSPTLTLASAPLSGSTLIGALGHRGASSSTTVDAAYTSLGTLVEGGTAVRRADYDAGSADSDILWGNFAAGASNPTAAVLIEIQESASGAYTLTAAAGSFTLSGAAASLERGFLLTAAAGSYALSGTAAALSYTRKLVAAAGSFAVSGTAADLRKGLTMVAAAGSYAVSGTAASLEKGFKLAAAAGSYALSGTDAAFRKGFILAAAAGSYTLSGTAAALGRTYALAAATGSFVLNGVNAVLNWSGFVPDAARTYTVKAESRTHSVVSESRTHAVKRETRTLTAD